MAKEDKQIERLINLTFAFLGADHSGRRFLTPEWVRGHVKGYGHDSPQAATKLLKRDIATLIRTGVPVETVATEQGPAFRLQSEDYALPEISFNAEEAAMLGLAGDLGGTGQLAAFARSGWTKLAASGATRSLGQAPAFNAVNDLSRLTPELLDTLLHACRHGRRISFDYTPDRVSESTRRTMDPWGIVSHRDRLYLTGHDIDRGAARSFRIFRVAEVELLGPASHPYAGENLQELVETGLRTQRKLIDALITAAPGTSLELTGRAEPAGPDRWRLIDVDRDWLIRTVAGYAPDAVLLEPTELRGEILALLTQAGEI